MKKVLVAGVFDFFHPGHRYFLESARQHGDHLTVIVARDENVLRIKGRLPYFSEEKRLEEVRKGGIADKVILGHKGGDFIRIVQENDPDVIVMGYDQHMPSGLRESLPKAEVIRLAAKNPDEWKSSTFRRRAEKGG